MGKQKRLSKKTQERFIRQGYKFRIRIPDNLEEALEVDRINGNTLWFDAKEMANVGIAYNVLDPGLGPPPTAHKRIPCRMIFDIKMDFTRKTRLVAG